MPRPRLEVGDIFRAHGEAFRHAHAGHLSLGQRKVMSAIEQCRAAALGGHVLRCGQCAAIRIAYNSCLMGSILLWGEKGLKGARDQYARRFPLPIKTWP